MTCVTEMSYLTSQLGIHNCVSYKSLLHISQSQIDCLANVMKPNDFQGFVIPAMMICELA